MLRNLNRCYDFIKKYSTLNNLDNVYQRFDETLLVFHDDILALEERIANALSEGDFTKFNQLSNDTVKLQDGILKSELFDQYSHHLAKKSFMSKDNPLYITNYDLDQKAKDEIKKEVAKQSEKLEDVFNSKIDKEKA